MICSKIASFMSVRSVACWRMPLGNGNALLSGACMSARRELVGGGDMMKEQGECIVLMIQDLASPRLRMTDD